MENQEHIPEQFHLFPVEPKDNARVPIGKLIVEWPPVGYSSHLKSEKKYLTNVLSEGQENKCLTSDKLKSVVIIEDIDEKIHLNGEKNVPTDVSIHQPDDKFSGMTLFINDTNILSVTCDGQIDNGSGEIVFPDRIGNAKLSVCQQDKVPLQNMSNDSENKDEFFLIEMKKTEICVEDRQELTEIDHTSHKILSIEKSNGSKIGGVAQSEKMQTKINIVHGKDDKLTKVSSVGLKEVGQTNVKMADEDVEVADAIHQKLAEEQEQSLQPLKEDLADWLVKILGIEIEVDTFLFVLDNGVCMCKLACLIQRKAEECVQEGSCTEMLPHVNLRYNSRAQSGTWFARDNCANFLKWAKEFGVKDECMFESEDLVSHKSEKSVVVCLLELARLGYRYGLEPPSIIKIEKELETEEAMDVLPNLETKDVHIVTKKVQDVPSSCHSISGKRKIISLDAEVRRIAFKCKCHEYVKRIRDGKYCIFGKEVLIRLLHQCHLMVRVGGGWETLEHYLIHHNPLKVFEFCRNEPGTLLDLTESGDKYFYIKSKYKSN